MSPPLHGSSRPFGQKCPRGPTMTFEGPWRHQGHKKVLACCCWEATSSEEPEHPCPPSFPGSQRPPPPPQPASSRARDPLPSPDTAPAPSHTNPSGRLPAPALSLGLVRPFHTSCRPLLR